MDVDAVAHDFIYPDDRKEHDMRGDVDGLGLAGGIHDMLWQYRLAGLSVISHMNSPDQRVKRANIDQHRQDDGRNEHVSANTFHRVSFTPAGFAMFCSSYLLAVFHPDGP